MITMSVNTVPGTRKKSDTQIASYFVRNCFSAGENVKENMLQSSQIFKSPDAWVKVLKMNLRNNHCSNMKHLNMTRLIQLTSERQSKNSTQGAEL